jgi:hypothetical protein
MMKGSYDAAMFMIFAVAGVLLVFVFVVYVMHSAITCTEWETIPVKSTECLTIGDTITCAERITRQSRCISWEKKE